MDKVKAITKKLEYMNTRSNIKLKQSLTFNTDILSNMGSKNRFMSTYQDQFQTDRPRMTTQYERLR